MCDLCKSSRDKIEDFITEEMKANAAAHDADYRPSDDVRVIIDILILKFAQRGSQHMLPHIMAAAVREWTQMQAEFEAEQGDADLKGIVLSPAPKLVQ
jgi:hypothetical protein